MKKILFLGSLILLLGSGCAGQTDVSVKNESGAVISPSSQTQQKEGVINYAISADSSVSYVVQKRFLNSDDVEVVGTSLGVEGKISLDSTKETVTINATIEPDFKTDSEGRDFVVRGMFVGPIAVTADGEPFSMDLSSTNVQSISAPLTVTINGISNRLNFKVDFIGGDSPSATGEARAKITDFGLKPPSALKIYTVDDEIGLKFDIRTE